MFSNSVSIEIKSIEDSPKYKAEDEFKMIKMENVTITKKGMKSGKPTVDIQCIDEKGNKYLIFATGTIIQSIATLINIENSK